MAQSFTLNGTTHNYRLLQLMLLCRLLLTLIRTITSPGFGTAFEDGIDGDRLPGSPKTQYSIYANYNYPLANEHELHINAGYAGQSDILSRAGARGSSFTLDSFGIANASVVYDADRWLVSVYVNNLFDEFAETGVQTSGLENQIVNGTSARSFMTNVLPPRTIGARFKYRF